MNTIVKAPDPTPEITALECPKCGCRHFEKTENPNAKRCRNCGRRVKYSVEGIAYLPLRTCCPVCKCSKTRTVHTESPVRYHKCLACGFNFKSVEAAA